MVATVPEACPIVLVIEDDEPARALVAQAAGAEGYAVIEAATAANGLALLRARPVDVVVLDLGLPDRDGLGLLRDIRRASAAPTIVVSGDARVESRIAGLRLGADDYLVKPVSGAEIGARVVAAARRAGLVAPPSDTVSFGECTFDIPACDLRVRGARVALSPRELALLVFFVRHPRQVFDRWQLLDEIWDDRTVDVSTVTEHVRTLRRKLSEPPGAPHHIVTVRGFGYRFDA